MDANTVKLTDEIIVENILGNLNIMYAGVGVLLLFSTIFIITFFAKIGHAKEIAGELEQKAYKKKLRTQCMIGFLIFTCLAGVLFVVIEKRKKTVWDFRVEIATVTDKRTNEGMNVSKKGSNQNEYHYIYVDSYSQKISEPVRYDDIDIGDKVYIIIRGDSKKNNEVSLENCAWSLDTYEYVGEKLE